QQSPQISSAATASEFGAMAAVTSGSWMEIHGVSLASHTRSWTQDDFNADSAPTSLDGTSVTIGGRPGFISFISPTQLNVLLPDGVSPGDQEVTITTAAGSTLPHISAVMAAQPGLLAAPSFKIGDRQYVEAVFQDGSAYAAPTGALSGVTSHPAHPGDVLV